MIKKRIHSGHESIHRLQIHMTLAVTVRVTSEASFILGQLFIFRKSIPKNCCLNFAAPFDMSYNHP